MRRATLAVLALLLGGAGLAQATCTQADARARMDTLTPWPTASRAIRRSTTS